MKKKTSAQIVREEARNNQTGKFIANPCHFCGRGAKIDNYCSDDRCNRHGGWGIVLHDRCADKLALMTDEEYAAAYAASPFGK